MFIAVESLKVNNRDDLIISQSAARQELLLLLLCVLSVHEQRNKNRCRWLLRLYAYCPNTVVALPTQVAEVGFFFVLNRNIEILQRSVYIHAVR